MALAHLQDMFPALPASTVESVLQHHSGDADRTAKALLGMTEVDHEPPSGGIFDDLFPQEGSKTYPGSHLREWDRVLVPSSGVKGAQLDISVHMSDGNTAACGNAPAAHAQKTTPEKFMPNGVKITPENFMPNGLKITPEKFMPTGSIQANRVETCDFDLDALLSAREHNLASVEETRQRVETTPVSVTSIGRAPKRMTASVGISPLSLETKLKEIMSERQGRGPVSLNPLEKPPKPPVGLRVLNPEPPVAALSRRGWWPQWSDSGHVQPPIENTLTDTAHEKGVCSLATGSKLSSTGTSGCSVLDCTGNTPPPAKRLTQMEIFVMLAAKQKEQRERDEERKRDQKLLPASQRPPPDSGSRLLQLLKFGRASPEQLASSPPAASDAPANLSFAVPPMPMGVTSPAPYTPPNNLAGSPAGGTSPSMGAPADLLASMEGAAATTSPSQHRSPSPRGGLFSALGSMQEASLDGFVDGGWETPNTSPTKVTSRAAIVSLSSSSGSRSPSPGFEAAAEAAVAAAGSASLQTLREIFSNLGRGAVQDVLEACNNDPLRAYEQLEAMQEDTQEIATAPTDSSPTSSARMPEHSQLGEKLEEKLALLKVNFPSMMDSVLHQALSEKNGDVDAAAAELVLYHEEALDQNRKVAEKLAADLERRQDSPISASFNKSAAAPQAALEGTSSWFDSLDTRSRATLEALCAAFPSTDFASVRTALEVSDYQLDLARELLRGNGAEEVEVPNILLHDRSPSNVVARHNSRSPSPRPSYSRDNGSKQHIWEEENGEIFRMQAEINSWTAKGEAAKKAGAYDKASYCWAKRSELIPEIAAMRRRAQRRISQRTNLDRIDTCERDLHNEPVHRALQILDQIIASREGMDVACDVEIVTGKGLHSKEGKPKIRPAVEQRLKELGIDYRYDGSNNGCIKFMIYPKEAL